MAEIIDSSYKELAEFVAWFNKIYGMHPIVIGGWAVYYYNDYFGSKDIDVVFEFKRQAWDKQLLSYFATHGYLVTERDKLGLVQTYRKEVNGDFIDIDACSIYDKNIFFKKEYCEKEVSYSLVKKHCIEVKIGNGTYRIPTVELLLLYKIKAYNDRDNRAKTSIDEVEIAYLQSKRDKDGSDVIALLDEKHCKEKVNPSRLRELIRGNNLESIVRETLVQIFNNSASMDKYGKLSETETGKLYKEIIGLLKL